MSYFIKIIALENCGYSKKALDLLINNNIDHELITINYSDKNKFKTDKINTYPQIYLMRQNSKGHLLLGGYDKLNEVINIFKNIKNKDNLLKVKEDFMIHNSEWSNKATLRLINLILNR
jgi:hypothetical protein